MDLGRFGLFGVSGWIKIREKSFDKDWQYILSLKKALVFVRGKMFYLEMVVLLLII